MPSEHVSSPTLWVRDPQTPADKAGKQIDSAVRIANHIERGNPAAIAGEGIKTRWEIRGELVQFDKGAP